MNLRSQIATSSWGGTRYVPMVFTEQGVAMLSSVLRSKRAIQINVQIMRAFVQLRHLSVEILFDRCPTEAISTERSLGRSLEL